MYFLLCNLFILVVIGKYGSIHIESIDMNFIKRILHPEYPQGGISYDPNFHYNYIVSSVAKAFDFEADSRVLATIFWFFEQAITVIVLLKICDLLFKGDRLTLFILVLTYLMLKSGETDQKTMLRPLHFLAIYYFLKEKWFFVAIFSASIFYLHIGVAIWWFVPSCFALGTVYLLNHKQVTILQITKYNITVLLLASPVLYFYLGVTQLSFTNNDFLARYWHGINNSIILNLIYNPKGLSMSLITIGLFTVGYRKWKKSGGYNDYIVPIAIGVLLLFVIDFVLVDLMFNGIALKLQLLRSFLNIEFFASLFFAYLIAGQLRNGNIVFCAVLLIFLIIKPFWLFFSVVDWLDALYVFYAVVLIFEIFEKQISVAKEEINLFFCSNSVLVQFKKTTNWIQHFVQKPVNLAGLFIIPYALIVTTMSSPIKLYVKSILGIQQKTGMSKSDSLLKDIARFTNEKIQGSDVILVFPFTQAEFEHYTNQKVFFTSLWLTGYVPERIDKFQYIFEKDLNYSIEKLRGGGSWDEMWRSVDERILLKWKKDYGITHVIRENEISLDFPVAYENEHYTIYDLRMLDNS